MKKNRDGDGSRGGEKTTILIVMFGGDRGGQGPGRIEEGQRAKVNGGKNPVRFPHLVLVLTGWQSQDMPNCFRRRLTIAN